MRIIKPQYKTCKKAKCTKPREATITRPGVAFIRRATCNREVTKSVVHSKLTNVSVMNVTMKNVCFNNPISTVSIRQVHSKELECKDISVSPGLKSMTIDSLFEENGF